MTQAHDRGRPRAKVGGLDVDLLGVVSLPRLTPLARNLLGRMPAGTSVPRYGSETWDALDDQDPRRAAGVIVAAECWRDHTSPERVAEDMRRQLAEEDEAVWQRIRDCSYDVAGAHDWSAESRKLTRAELQQRRGAA